MDDGDHRDACAASSNSGSNHVGSSGSVNGPIEFDRVTVEVAENGPLSDGESTYGDTLTQTSITKLLSKKFKVTIIFTTIQATHLYFLVLLDSVNCNLCPHFHVSTLSPNPLYDNL